MSKPRILIVDDSVTIRKALLKQLKNLDAEVTQAVDGVKGLEAANAGEFDLIISDVDMPNMNGFDMCQKIKSDPKTGTMPVLILSSRDRDEDIERGFRVGADGYLTKSGGPGQFLNNVRDFLDKMDIIRDRRMLVVDDSPLIRKKVCGSLKKVGYKVMEAENGRQALDILNSDTKIDLIISDIDMPVMDGLQFAKELQSQPHLKMLPLLIMSSQDDRAMIRRMYQLGASAYMVKPFSMEQLQHSVEKLLSDHFQNLLLEKERLRHEHSMMLSSITSLIQALEARDVYTRGHSEAVAEIAVGMGSVMGFAPDELESLEIAARLHDLGKIGIPDSVLLKPGKLTVKEYEVIKTHPTIGAEILKPIPSMEQLIPAVLSHHERMDGKGYPYGIKGDKIPLWARIIAVGDIYHALTSNRPYRDPMPEERVLQIIDDARVGHLCPNCVDVFLKFIEQ
ncbi:response regulator [Desulfovibrio ferrophilus]|uniref:Response regulator receiver modulated metal dependent phosphohydrolase n=1 Tax=Desulfovibrio ferrophilus TaxID=241368 RepID=A0A2Z6B1U0_9BACT|nr:response regulator [Desulfovibrio ferrophilus]BBD09418.1 response regulator receiver modulated metal dependent phosphohydrolase [Desulfovibrio ferrophilus]